MIPYRRDETTVPRMYDVNTDAFITERAEIIDNLVLGAARLLTFTERGDSGPNWIAPEVRGCLWRAAAGDDRDRRVLRHVVRMGWLAWVITE